MSVPTAELPTTAVPLYKLHYVPRVSGKDVSKIETSCIGGAGRRVSSVNKTAVDDLPSEMVDAAVNLCTNHHKSMVFGSDTASYYCAPVRDADDAVIGTLIAEDKSNMVPDALLQMLRTSAAAKH